MSEFMNTDGSFGDMATAPESLRTLVEAKGFKGIEDISTAYSNIEQMKGDWNNPDSMKLPKTFTDEHTAMLNERRGVPKDGGYTYDFGDSKIDEGLLTGVQALAKQDGWTQDQYKNTVDLWQATQANAGAAYEAEVAELKTQGEEANKTSWGDQYDTNVAKADEFAVKMGLDKLLANYGINEYPDVRAKLFEMSAMTDESALPGHKITVVPNKQERMDELMNSDAMKNRAHPEHKATHEEWLKLQRG